jgi:hypothetical protein
MGFPNAAGGTGWSCYSTDPSADRFSDAGRGTALLVSISEAGAPPTIETVDIGRLSWLEERLDVTAQPLGEVFAKYAERDKRELTVLRLQLRGVVDPEKFRRLDEELRNIVCNRYCAGSSLQMDDVLIEPSAEQLRQIVGEGVLARVLARLQQEANSAQPSMRSTARHAMKLLYRHAWEEQRQ